MRENEKRPTKTFVGRSENYWIGSKLTARPGSFSPTRMGATWTSKEAAEDLHEKNPSISR
jgi:hypothetical protein